MRRFFCAATTLAVCLGAWRCSQSPTTVSGGGSTTETTNGIIAGVVTTDSGVSVVAAVVRLIPARHNPAVDPTERIREAVTDDSGAYAFTRVAAGSYNLVAHTPGGNHAALIPADIAPGDSLTLPEAVIRPPGAIELFAGEEMIGAVLYVPGTQVWEAVLAAGPMRIEGVPAAVVELYSYAPGGIDEPFWGAGNEPIEVPVDGVADLTTTPGSPTGQSLTAATGQPLRFAVPLPAVYGRPPEYRIAWGDADTSAWTARLSIPHAWSRPGAYHLRGQVRWLETDTTGWTMTRWSSPTTVTIE